MKYNWGLVQLTDEQKGHMLKIIEDAMQVIKTSFDVDQQKYAGALNCLKLCRLKLQNKQVRKPTKREMHFFVDVIHEIEDMHASSNEKKKENEEIAMAMKMLVNIFAKD